MQEKLKELLTIRNGNLFMREARKLGIATTTIQKLVNQGKLTKVDRGYCIEDDHGIDDLFWLQQQFSRGIFSREATLDVYQLSTNMSKFIHLAFPHGCNADRSIAKEQQLQFHFVKKEVYRLGKVERTPFQGNPITMYDKERALCGIWNPRYEIGYRIKPEALKEYMEDPLRDPSKLRDYMTELHVEKEMKHHMQSLY